MSSINKKPVDFDFPVGRVLARKYRVIRRVGAGWEGEVYLVNEIETDIARAIKIFYPDRNPNNRTLKRYAKVLHKLRDNSLVIHYYTQETIVFKRQPIKFLVSDFIEGEKLFDYIQRQPGKRLHPYQATHLLHSLAKGIEQVHDAYQYHGDLHIENIMVQKAGLRYDLKLIDFFHWQDSLSENKKEDVVDMVKIYHEILGGKKHYARHPEPVKKICLGLKRSLILNKFKNARGLRKYLESMSWD